MTDKLFDWLMAPGQQPPSTPRGPVAVTAVACIALLASCAGRSPAPVSVAQPFDNVLTCPAMVTEVSSNDAKISELSSQKGTKVAQNVAAGVAGLFIWPLWLLMDFQGAAATEIKALQDRNAYLGTKIIAETCKTT